ncbi:MAG: glycosyltransferase family 4 protein [Acidobacteriia bacterium]|nr:glycosyltransferase family 4 protein [Terriglobia bacterium]
MNTSNVLIIASDYKPKPGGRAEYIDQLARGLISLGNRTKVLAVVQSHRKERLAFLEKYEEWVIPFPVVHDERPKDWLGNKFVSLLEIVRCVSPNAQRVLERTRFFRASANSVARLESVLEAERPTMVVFGHLDMRLYPFALLFLERRAPYGIIAHESEIYRFPNRKNELIRRGMMLEGAQWIAANSRHTKSLVEMWGIPSGKIKIIHPPIAEEAIRALVDLEQNRSTRDELNTVSICRLVQPKGIDTVIRALKILDGRGIPCRHVIAGDGVERTLLEGLVDELGLRHRIQFTGHIADDEKWRLLRNSDVFVMPSRVDPKMQHEGFGMAFVEAAAFGLPGVGSRAGGIPDAIVDGETGILVPQDSPESLADALTFLYRNPGKREDMGRAAMQRAKSQFSPTAVAARFQEEIRKNA